MPYCQIHYPTWPHCLKMNNSIDLDVVMLHSLEVVTEIHANATFKVVSVNMGYQLLTIHCMVQNYVRYCFIFICLINFKII